MPDYTRPQKLHTLTDEQTARADALTAGLPRYPNLMQAIGQLAAEATPARDARRTLCVDFDGVLHSYTSPWAGAEVIPDPPVPGAFAFLAAAVVRFRVAVFSARSHQPGGIDAMRRWFAAHGLPGHALDALEFPTEKPQAIVYLDDRGWRFDGTWPSLDELAAFQPWNRRKPAP